MAEGAPLLREYGDKISIEGSNPSLSAILDLKKTLEFMLRRFLCAHYIRRVRPSIWVRQIIGNNLNREGAAKRVNTGMYLSLFLPLCHIALKKTREFVLRRFFMPAVYLKAFLERVLSTS